MIFSIVIILLFLVVAYFQYIQGGFTAIISAACALFAMLIAFGYYEALASMLAPGAMADYVPGALLIALFGVTYVVLRVITDSVVPGNVALQLYVDRISAILFSLVAAGIAVGTFTVGAQLMPFGPAVGDYGRYKLGTRTNVTVSRFDLVSARNDVDTDVRDEIVDPSLAPESVVKMLLPVDDWVVSVAAIASDGSLSGSKSFSVVHPDYLGQAALNRAGAGLGATRLAMNTGGVESAKVVGLFTLGSFKPLDTEIPQLREGAKSYAPKFPANQAYVVARVHFDRIAADSDGMIRLPLASVRLNLNGTNYRAIGTMESSGHVGIGRPDDLAPISLKGDIKGADFVFAVEPTVLAQLAPGKKFKADAGFVEVKMLARTDLSGMTLTDWSASPSAMVMRKKNAPIGAVSPQTAAPAAGS